MEIDTVLIVRDTVSNHCVVSGVFQTNAIVGIRGNVVAHDSSARGGPKADAVPVLRDLVASDGCVGGG